jgi:SAM-dependent methyltransferase
MTDHDDWDRHWDRYAAAAERNPAQQMRHRLVLRLLREGGTGAGRRVLDIGSGQGDLLVRLARQWPQADYAGVELSRKGVGIAQAKLPRARLVVADLFAPPAELAQLTGWATEAVCSEVLEHVDDPAAFLRAARPLLADGARLVVTVPGGPMSAFDRHIGHRRHFTRESIRSVLQAGGFAVDRVRMAGFPFFNLYRLVVILRGARLAADVEEGNAGGSSGLAAVAMRVFRGLFALNLSDSPWGWQVVAVARKAGAA